MSEQSEALVLQKLAEFKRQLRTLSKNDLIRSYVGQYATTVRLTVENQELQKQIKAMQPETEKTND